jgi:hypothetical protein
MDQPIDNSYQHHRQKKNYEEFDHLRIGGIALLGQLRPQIG